MRRPVASAGGAGVPPGSSLPSRHHQDWGRRRHHRLSAESARSDSSAAVLTAGGASRSSSRSKSKQASAGGVGVCAGRAGTLRLAPGLFRTPRLRALRAAAAPCGVRPPLGCSLGLGSGRERWWGRRRLCTRSS